MGIVEVPRILVSVWGEPKTGKSHFALSFPEPMVAVEIGETGIEDILYRFPNKEIRYKPLFMRTLAPKISDHAKLLADFETILYETIKGDARTLLIDSASQLWKSVYTVKREEAFEDSERKKRNQADFGLANDYFEQIVQEARVNRSLNLVLVHRHREKYARLQDESGNLRLQGTGVMEARDYSGMENLMQIIVRCGKGKIYDPKTKSEVTDFMHTIEVCRFDPDLEGLVVQRLDYDKLVDKIFVEHG